MHYRQNGDWVDDLKDVANDFYEVQIAGRVDSLVQSTVAPSMSAKLQRLATTQAKGIVEHLVNAIPPEEELNRIADQISQKIIIIINQRILPQLFNDLEDDQIILKVDLEKVYTRTLESIPESVSFEAMGLDLNLNLRSIFASSFTLDDLNNLYETFRPMALRIQDQVAPVAENKIRQVIGFTLLCGILIGGVSTFAFTKLYRSAE